MSRVMILGATGSLGRQLAGQALAARHQVTVFVRTPSKLAPEVRDRVSVHTGDLGALVPLDLIRGQDALINCAGHVAGGDACVGRFDRVITAVDSLPPAEQPVCWFLAGAAIGLLLMRLVVGSVLLVRVGPQLWNDPLLPTAFASLPLAGSGLLLLAGYGRRSFPRMAPGPKGWNGIARTSRCTDDI